VKKSSKKPYGDGGIPVSSSSWWIPIIYGKKLDIRGAVDRQQDVS
jgi:hypothetical protein